MKEDQQHRPKQPPGLGLRLVTVRREGLNYSRAWCKAMEAGLSRPMGTTQDVEPHCPFR